MTYTIIVVGRFILILVLSQAIARPDEPPLGCAVLTLQFSLRKGRVLIICGMAHEGHLPRKQFNGMSRRIYIIYEICVTSIGSGL